MRKFQLFLLSAIVVFISNSVFAQHNHSDHNDHMNCGQQERTEAFFQEFPEQRAIAEEAQKQLEAETKVFSIAKGTEDEILIIPVVFHIVHIGGTENISYEQVQSAIDILNEDFSASNADLIQVVDEFEDIIGNVELEFRLAKIDPDGNCTNGINRVFSETTNVGDTNMKLAAGSWDRSSYLNIWVCRQIGEPGELGTTLGYATFPSSVNGGAGASVDGIVMRSDNIGNIGTASGSNRHTLSHEIGHWINLSHTWGNGNLGGCASDNVADTPTTSGSQDCDLNSVTCGSLDNTQNFMDYTFCFVMFTEGQVNRMRASLNSSIAQRNQLHTPANLAETGVLEPDEICFAEFETDKEPRICMGQEITYQDVSYNGVEEWSWVFEGGSPATSTEANPTVLYENPGVYEVSLTASNPQGELTVVKNDFVTVLGEAQYALPFEEGFENISEIGENDEWSSINPDGSAVLWKITDDAAYSGSQSVYVRGRSNVDFQTETLDSPTFDLTGLEDNAVLSFKYAHARRNSTSDDLFRVRISRNCGENWNVRETRDIDDLPTVSGNVSGQFVPDSEDDWEEVVIDNISSIFLTSEFRVRFEFTSVNGNNIYIDDINIYDPNTLSVDNSDVVKEITLFPNPATDNVRLRLDLTESQDVRIDIVDASGRVVQSPFSGIMTSGTQSLEIQLDPSLTTGMYFVRLTGEEGIAVRKLIVK